MGMHLDNDKFEQKELKIVYKDEEDR